MSRIVLDAELRAKLNGATAVVEFTDETGNVVGSYVPRGQVTDEMFERMMAAIARPLSREELDEARKEMLEHGGVSGDELRAQLAEIVRHWEARR